MVQCVVQSALYDFQQIHDIMDPVKDMLDPVHDIMDTFFQKIASN